MATRLLWRARAKLAVVATAFGGGAAAAAIASSDDPQRALKVCTTVPTRLIRDSITAATIAFGSFFSKFHFCVVELKLGFFSLWY